MYVFTIVYSIEFFNQQLTYMYVNLGFVVFLFSIEFRFYIEYEQFRIPDFIMHKTTDMQLKTYS